MGEVNADRKAHGRASFDDEDLPKFSRKSVGTTPPKRSCPGGRGRKAARRQRA